MMTLLSLLLIAIRFMSEDANRYTCACRHETSQCNRMTRINCGCNLKQNAKTLPSTIGLLHTPHVCCSRWCYNFSLHFFLFRSQLWNQLWYPGSAANCIHAKYLAAGFQFGLISTRLTHTVIYFALSTLPDLQEAQQRREHTRAQHTWSMGQYIF